MSEFDPFPHHHALMPGSPPQTGIFARRSLLRQVIEKVERDEWVALWAARYGGRTTFLRQIEAHYQQVVDCLPVYIVPHLHLNPSGRDLLFSSLAAQIESTYGEEVRVHSEIDWGDPDGLSQFISEFLKTTNLRRIVVLLDDCDQLPSTSLVDLLRALRQIQAQRRIDKLLLGLSLVIAGAVSFHNLKLLEETELSPFESWPWFTLEDLTCEEGTEYLTNSFGRLGIEEDPAVFKILLEYGGGDLNRLNHLCAVVVEPAIGHLLQGDAVQRGIGQLLATSQTDPSSSYTISFISQDPRCLDVLARVMKGEPRFLRSHLDTSQSRVFGLSNPELSGGFLLDRDERRGPVAWRFRNRFAEELLRRHFQPATMMRAFLDLRRFKDVQLYAAELEHNLAKSFRDNILNFQESALRDIIEARWEHLDPTGSELNRGTLPQAEAGARWALSGDRVDHGFSLISLLLFQIFGFEEATLYERSTLEEQLIPNNKLPSPPFTPGQIIELSDSRLREVRVLRSGLYAVEIEGAGHLKIVIPLRDFRGRVTGMVSIRSQEFMESWAALFIRVPIVERSLNLVWRKLSRVAAEQASLLERALAPGRALTEHFVEPVGGHSHFESGEEPALGRPPGVPAFVVIKLDTDLFRHLRLNLQRFPELLAPEFLKRSSGYVYDCLLNAMRDRDPLILCEISKINCNVFFELGLAIGLNRPGIPLLEAGHKLLPELAKGLFYLPYKLRRQLGQHFLADVRRSWEQYQSRREDRDFVHILAWRFNSKSRPPQPYIVVIDHNGFGDDKSFRKAVDGAAANAGFTVKHLWDERNRLQVFPEGASGTILTTVYTLLRQATAVIARSEKVEETPEQASHFIAIGMAKGFEESLGTPRLFLCQREHSPEGQKLEMPSDLLGLPSIDPTDRQFGARLAKLFEELRSAEHPFPPA